jgi:CRISPR-associated protein Cmr3
VGKVDLIGMGFPVARLQRKPIYSAIFPGSMIQFGEGCQVTGDVCESGIGEFSNLGYGTVIPFS